MASQKKTRPKRRVKIIIERHSTGYVAQVLGVKGIVLGEGDTHKGALADIKSALKFHIETFGEYGSC